MMETERDVKKVDGFATKMWNHMVKEFGEDWREWPIVGCGARFMPYKYGPSMVLVMEVNEGEFVSVLAERPPTLIDEAFKATRVISYRQVMEHLVLSQQLLELVMELLAEALVLVTNSLNTEPLKKVQYFLKKFKCQKN